LFRK